jgi:hypothetical protein
VTLETFRWLSLWVGAGVAGVACYVLVGYDRMPGVAAMAGMTMLTGWFVYEDIRIDGVLERDLSLAEHKETQWPTYRP